VSASDMVQCSACKIAVSPHERNSHYRSDWHRYNVKRKCVGMAPLSKSLFESKLNSILSAGQQMAASSKRKQKKAAAQSVTKNYEVLTQSPQWEMDSPAPGSLLVYRCTLCRRSFKSHQQCASHLATKKHRAKFLAHHKALREAQQSEIDVFRATNGDDPSSEAAAVPMQHAMDGLVPLDKLEVLATVKNNPFIEIKPFEKRPPAQWVENDDIDPTKSCIFCAKWDGAERAENVVEVMCHLEAAHGFFVPRPRRLIALEPLLFLVAKCVGTFHQCTWCWATFHSLKGVRRHIEDKRHCKLWMDGEHSPFREHFDFEMRIEFDLTADSGDDAEHKDGTRDVVVLRGGDRPRIAEINEHRELVRSDGTRIGHRLNAVAYKKRVGRRNDETQTEEQIIAQINDPERKLKLEMMIKKRQQLKFEESGAAEQTKGAAREQAKRMRFQQMAHKVSLCNWIALQKSRCLLTW